MTRKLTLFIVCAFEIALILFVAAWTALASSTSTYNCTTEAIVEIKDGITLQKPNFSFSLEDTGKFFIFTVDKNNGLYLDREMAVASRDKGHIFLRSLFTTVWLSKNQHLYISDGGPLRALSGYAKCVFQR